LNDETTDIKNIPPPTGAYSLSGEEYSLKQLGETLGTTIKHDSATKKILFINTLPNNGFRRNSR